MSSETHEVTVAINDIILDQANSAIYDLKIEESILNEIPKLTMKVLLSGTFVTDTFLVDGSEITLRVNYLQSGKPMEDWKFKLYSYTAVSSGKGDSFIYTITAYHEALWKLSQLETKYYNTTVSEVFKQIAIDNKLSYDIDQSQDKQVWFSLEGNRLSFLRDICLHSYVGPYSVNYWWVSKNGVLKFKDLVNQIFSVSKWNFSEVNDLTIDREENEVFVTTPVYEVESGMNNFTQGYGLDGYCFNVTGGSNEIYHPKDFLSKVETLNVSDDAKTQRFRDLGVNIGNTHANYNKATMQNLRGRALWSTTITCIDQNACSVDVGDCVTYTANIDGAQPVKIYSGNYIVSNVTTSFNQLNVPVNKIVLMRQGVDETKLEG